MIAFWWLNGPLMLFTLHISVCMNILKSLEYKEGVYINSDQFVLVTRTVFEALH
jgi:hypothetical protein